MKYLSIFFGLLLLSGCGFGVTNQATFTPLEIHATQNIVTATSITATSLVQPPHLSSSTNTPLPTFTPTPEPSSTPTKTPLPYACNSNGLGLSKIEYVNNSSQEVLAILSSTICYKEINVDPGSSITISVPISSYYYYGYIGSQISFGGTVYLSDVIHTWVLTFTENGASLETP